MVKKLINSHESCVNDIVEGLLLTNSNLKRLGNLNVLVRSDLDTIKNDYVTLLSGGGSGHEPAHAGYIGHGMLTGIVLGNVFASPSVSSILAAIRAITGPKGLLVIVKNYTGDRLNFGVAIELARQEGFQVMMLIVSDDTALPIGKGITGGRGIGGTVLVHKIAGALATNPSLNLNEIHRIVTTATQRIRTLGVALSPCNLPGVTASDSHHFTRLSAPQSIEVGLGIHGEPGREEKILPSHNAADYVATLLLDGILHNTISSEDVNQSIQFPKLKISSENQCILLLNNLGSLPVMEMIIMAKSIIQQLVVQYQIYPVRVYSGTFVSSIDMSGLSLTIMSLQDPASSTLESMDFLPLLDEPCQAMGWNNYYTVLSKDMYDGISSNPSCISSKQIMNYDESQYTKAISKGFPIQGSFIIPLVHKICNKVIEIEPTLTQYDAICGDGDCGLVMKKGAQAILASLPLDIQESVMDSAWFCNQLASAISGSMGGTSGALLELFFRAMGSHFSEQYQLDREIILPDIWVDGFRKGVDAIMFYGGAVEGMRTMLDALIPACRSLENRDGIKRAAEVAMQGMELTKEMDSGAGRANYVTLETIRGIPDPGAFAAASIINVIAQEYS